MLAPVKPEEGRLPTSPAALPSVGAAYTLAELQAALAAHAGLPLVFAYGGRDVQPGYHVTEVKSGWFASLDCGANPENWRETIIQLWDVREGATYMSAGKFLAILGKVTSAIDLDQDTRLTFEVSDGVAPMQLYRATAIEIENDAVRVTLGSVPASCKPRERWLESGDAKPGQASCGSQTQASCGCA